MRYKSRSEIRIQLQNSTESLESENKIFSYGVVEFYKTYAGMEKNKHDWLHVPHSIWTGCSDDMFCETEMSSLSYSTMLVYNQWDQLEYLRLLKGRKDVEVVSHPFYIIQNIYGKTPDEKKNGTVFFYPHGLGTACPPALKSEQLIRYLTSLGAESQPIYICFHYNDFKLFNLSVFKDKGIIPVSAGDPKDQDFMVRLYTQLDEAKKTTVEYEEKTKVLADELRLLKTNKS